MYIEQDAGGQVHCDQHELRGPAGQDRHAHGHRQREHGDVRAPPGK